MSSENAAADRYLLSSANSAVEWKQTSWGEAMRPVISGSDTGGLFSLFDFEAPAGFGPPRHYHLDDAEAMTITSGRLAVWTTSGTSRAEAGDTVYFPKKLEHTWKVAGTGPVRMRILMSPGKFEVFFDLAAERALRIDEGPAMLSAAEDSGIVVTGMPLTAEEADTIMKLGERK